MYNRPRYATIIMIILMMQSTIAGTIPAADAQLITTTYEYASLEYSGPVIIGILDLNRTVDSVFIDPLSSNILLVSDKELIIVYASNGSHKVFENPVDNYTLYDFSGDTILYGNATSLLAYSIRDANSSLVYSAPHGYSIVSSSIDPALGVLAVALDNGVVEVRSIVDNSILARKILGFDLYAIDLQHGVIVLYSRNSVSLYNMDLQRVTTIDMPGPDAMSVLVNPRGSGFAVASTNTAEVYNRYGALVYSIHGSNPRLAWSPDGSMLFALYGGDGLVYGVIYDLNGSPLGFMEASLRDIVGASWSNRIALVSSEGIIYYLITGEQSDAQPYSVSSIEWSPFSDHIIAGYHDSVALLDSSLNVVWNVTLPYRVLDISDSASLIAVASSNGTYILDHLGSISCIIDTGLTNAVEYITDDIIAFTGVKSGLIDASSCSIIKLFEVPRGFVGTSITGSLDHNLVFVLGVNGVILAFEIDTGMLVASRDIGYRSSDTELHSSRGLLFIASSNGLYVLDSKTLSLVKTILQGVDVTRISVDPRGSMVSAIVLGRPAIIDLNNESIITLNIPYSRSISWSPNGFYIAIGYDAGVSLVEAPSNVASGIELSPVVRPIVVAIRNVTHTVVEKETETVTVTEVVEAEPVVETVVETKVVTETVTETIVEKETVVVYNTTTITVVKEVTLRDSLISWYDGLREKAGRLGLDLDVMIAGLSTIIVVLLIIVVLARPRPKTASS